MIGPIWGLQRMSTSGGSQCMPDFGFEFGMEAFYHIRDWLGQMG
ncbi:MAG: hypothetical protein ABIF77_17695 [bacterium]